MKRKTFKTKAVIIFALVAMLVVGVVAFVSNGFTNSNIDTWGYDRNPDNLVKYEVVNNFSLSNGLRKDVEKDGTIHVTGFVPVQCDTSGNPKATQWSLDACIMTLSAGEYTISNDVSGNYYMYVEFVNANGTKETYRANANDSVFVLEKDTEIRIRVNGTSYENVDEIIRPIINKGNKPIDYYVKKTIGADKK